MTKLSGKQDSPSDLEIIYEYHDRTKHHLHRYALSLGYMDWSSQPDPFRRYNKSTTFPLEHPPATPAPGYDSLFHIRQPAAPLNRESISRLFYESLAISAWKQAGNNRWSLRVNPSSGDLHPTEAYLISGPVEGLTKEAGVYHYSPFKHELEQRITLTEREWESVSRYLPQESLLIVLASIYWRESWKYGERAFRYCHHDVGHAIGTVAFATAALGWKTVLLPSVKDEDMEILTGINRQEGIEAEHADCLLLVYPSNADPVTTDNPVCFPATLLARLKDADYEGYPNTLSSHHHAWPVVDAVAKACRVNEAFTLHLHSRTGENTGTGKARYSDRNIPVRKIIRQRRSAVSMDKHTGISKEIFYRMIEDVCPYTGNNILDVLPWPPHVSLALFLHRVNDLPAGLYMLVRNTDHESSLRSALLPGFLWDKPDGCPDSLPLYLLQSADARDAARTISCHQDIAADGAFALGMLAKFDTALEQYGASFYPRLFWETGLIGQILYLEAEAAGIRSTGIGCFFDDAMHQLLGIHDHSWQSLYHFTIGGAVDDQRLQTLPSYWHIKNR